MKIKSIAIHNFRSLQDVTFNLYDYSILVGANNTGKTAILTALRIFYENDIKYNDENDFPKFPVKDNESWIEINFRLTNNEFATLKDEYKNPGNILKVRKYLKSEDSDKVKVGQSNIYGYENRVLSKNLFYGARNISQAKLGDVIYIPEVTETDETLKLSGPSPLRNMLNFVVKKVVKTSKSFQELTTAFEGFDDKFREEQSKEGLSLHSLEEDINESLKEWKMRFGININPLKPEEIVKNLVSHALIDESLGKEVSIKNVGQGLQRHIIFTLLQLSSKYVEKKEYEKKEFAPDFTLLLFEEPEAFLHPCQQECLNRNLQTFSSNEGQQIIISTHSPIFVSKNVEELPSLVKLAKDSQGITRLYQISEKAKKLIIEENSQLVEFLRDKLKDKSIESSVKQEIERRYIDITDDVRRMEEESMRYMLWLDATRCAAFFSEIVLLCEGPSEKIFIEYLIENEWKDLAEKRACILDVMGKYNIHRFMNLFKELGIRHSILLDKDENKIVQNFINEFIKNQRNSFTNKIYFFERNIETFLGIAIPPANRKDKKPLNIMWNYFRDNIPKEKLDQLKNIIKNLLE